MGIQPRYTVSPTRHQRPHQATIESPKADVIARANPRRAGPHEEQMCGSARTNLTVMGVRQVPDREVISC